MTCIAEDLKIPLVSLAVPLRSRIAMRSVVVKNTGGQSIPLRMNLSQPNPRDSWCKSGRGDIFPTDLKVILRGALMEREEIIRLLQVRGAEQEALFRRARAIREENFGKKAIVRGVIEVTDACRVNCAYCPMRVGNKNNRYVMSSDEIIEAAKPVKELGLKVVFFQGGEVPITKDTVGEAIPKIRRLFDDDVEILLCLGDKTKEEYAYLKQQGADSYILKHETSDPELHRKMRSSKGSN